MAPSDPTHIRARHQLPVGSGDLAGKPILHILTERVVRCELRHLGTLGPPISVPLSVRGSILQIPTPGCRVATQLPRDRRWRSAQLPGDRTNPNMLSVQDGDLLAFGEGQVTARQWHKRERLHPATLPEPARSDSRRQSCRHAGFLARQPAGNTFPETLLMLTTPPRRATRRPHRRTQRPISRSTFLPCHRNSSHSRCCDHQLNPPCVRRASRTDADDATAEVFAVAWRRRHDIPGGDRALPWLYGVARRVLSHQRRSAHRFRRLAVRVTELRDPPLPDPEAVAVQRQEYADVRRAVGQLASGDREVLLLAAWEGLSHRQIADVLDCSQAAVDKRFIRAKQRLAKTVQGQFPTRFASSPGERSRKRWKPMSKSEQVYALLIEANPVPDPDVLPERFAEVVPRLRVADQRRATMHTEQPVRTQTEHEPIQTKTAPTLRRRNWIPAVAAAVVVILAGASFCC